MERAAPRREGLLKLKFGTVCTSTLFARITVRLIELSVLWAHAAHTGTDFSFTRKVSKSVSKRRCPLGYLLRDNQICKNLSKNGTLVPFLGAMTQNFVFTESKTLPFTHSHFVTRPLIYHETAVISLGKSIKF